MLQQLYSISGLSEYESLLLQHTAGLANPGAVDVHMMVRCGRSDMKGSARGTGGGSGSPSLSDFCSLQLRAKQKEFKQGMSELANEVSRVLTHPPITMPLQILFVLCCEIPVCILYQLCHPSFIGGFPFQSPHSFPC